ncbi:MAG: hypothetical protein JW782_06115 [Candidatus Saganbacteria bacterium]|nr:hypothetical protein [Candidatus Saganbacteria bacterium]
MKQITVIFVLLTLLVNTSWATLEAVTLKLDPGVKTVVVVPAEYEFEEERAEFTEFRARYATFWIFFYLTAFIMPYVW